LPLMLQVYQAGSGNH